jgi:hypothetical protein
VLLAKEQPSELHDVRIAVTGSWVKNGKRFSITKSDLSDIVKNFEQRKNDAIVVDYDHASEMPEVAHGQPIPAAGWIKQLSVKNGSLIASVQWTDRARKLIQSEEYRFISPAIDFEGHDKESGDGVGACLTSMALTNHPFLEELPPLVLSEHGANLADADVNSDRVITVPIPEDDGQGLKVKVKVEKKPKEKEDVKMGDQGTVSELRAKKRDDEEPDDDECEDEAIMSELHGAVDLAEKDPNVKEGVSKKDYAYVGDPDDKSTWKYKLDTEGRARNALARWGQHKGIPKSEEAGVLRKIISKAKGYGIKVDKDNPKYKIAASAASGYGVRFDDLYNAEVTMAEDAQDTKVTMGDDGQTDENKSPYVRDQKDLQKKLKKEAKDRADNERDDNEEECDDAMLAEAVELALDDTGEPPASIPRFKIRQVKSKDSIGKLRHHAVVAGDGKLCGYVTNGDFQTYAKRMMGPRKDENPEKTMADEIYRLTGRPLKMPDVVKMVEFAAEHEDDFSVAEKRRSAIEKLLPEMFRGGRLDTSSWRTAQRVLLNDSKIGLSDREVSLLILDAQEAIDLVNKVTAEGKFIPLQREPLVRLCLSDRPLFDSLTKNAVRVIDYGERGVAGNGQEGLMTPAQELDLKTRQYLSDNKLGEDRYADAARTVMKKDRDLAQRYRTQPRGGPVQ